jgi:drug/metabolite transporter (DMT)-like permease
MFLRYLILVFGVMACSTSVIFIKLGSTHPILLTAYRQLLAGVILLPLFVTHLKRHHFQLNIHYLKRIVPPALILAIHFITWIMGARMTPAANASLIVNMTPVAMPLVMFVMVREIVTQRELVGTFLAVCGICLLGLADFNYSPIYAMGDLTCLGSMLMVTLYLSYSRRNKDMPSIWLYVIPIYWISGSLCFLLGLGLYAGGIIPSLIGPDLSREWISILGLAIFPTVLGHSTLNWAMKHLRSQTVALVNVWQFMFAGAMAFMLWNEIPHLFFYVAGGLVISGTAVVLMKKTKVVCQAA